MLPSRRGGPSLFPLGIDDIATTRVPQVSGNEKRSTCFGPLPRCRSMSLKAQLDACRREYEADAEPQVVDAARRSIQALAETGLVAKAVKAGERAPLFRLRCARGGPPGNRAPGRNACRSLAAGSRSVVLSRQSRRTAVSYIARSWVQSRIALSHRLCRPRAVPGRVPGAGLPQSGEDRIERLDAADTRHPRPR